MNGDEIPDAARVVDLLQGALAEFPGGSVLAAVLEQYPRVQRLRALNLVKQILDILDEDGTSLVRRLKRDPRIQRMLWDAASAASSAEIPAKIAAMAAVVARGLADDAALDEANYLLGILRELEIIDIRILLSLETAALDSEKHRNTSETMGLTVGVAQSINAKLLGLGVVQSHGRSYSNLHSAILLAPLGEQILDLLRSQGDPLAV